jgi:ATP-dependent exoDNAse (exonuclease V) alpha subunit
LLRALTAAQVPLDLYVVTPFVIVADNLRRVIRQSGVLDSILSEDDIWKWTLEHVGTVHTVQGREAEAVIFVLGAPKPGQTGARGWAGDRRNLLNVAVTRAKEVLYVIGNRNLWREAGHFRELHAHLND